jgi:multicomponent Na+:H+ antiporter subunit F
LSIFFAGAAVFVAVNAFICLYRMVKGPTVQDRLLTLGVLGSSMLAILVLLASVYSSYMYLDVAILFVLVSFIVMIFVSRYLETYGREVDDSDR